MHSILVYHSISSPPEPLPADADISPRRFEQQLAWLQRWRQVVPLEDTLHSPASERLVSITFDDGYRDNLTVALPLLEKFQLPMTLFVVAGFLGREGYLSEVELRELSRHPLVTIGSHGLWHRHFTRLNRHDARFELNESRRLLAGITGDNVDLLAWPYGECNADLERLSAACGYRASWSVWKGTNSTHSRWRVPLGRRDNLARFVVKASGMYALTKAKWHRQRAEVRTQESEVRSRIAKVPSQTLEVRSPRSEVRSQSLDVPSQRGAARSQGSQYRILADL